MLVKKKKKTLTVAQKNRALPRSSVLSITANEEPDVVQKSTPITTSQYSAGYCCQKRSTLPPPTRSAP